jgi:phosphate transport system substrate-binding protein
MNSAKWTVALSALAAFSLAVVCGGGNAADNKKADKDDKAPKTVSVDPKLLDYKEGKGVSGSIKSVGSDTMNNLMALWGEGFKKHYPSITIEIEGKGSNTAPPALIKSTSNFGPMSRAMKKAEIDDFEKAFDYKPTGLKVAIDTLGVFVNKDCPIKELSLEQVDAIFSKNRKGGAKEDIKTWGQLGLKGEWADKPISLYGRNSESGTYGFFKEHALFGGDYKDSVKEQVGSSSVIDGVAKDKYAMGYSGIGYKTEDTRAVPLKAAGGDKAYEANAENAYSGDYPLSRVLYLYVNYKPNSELDPLRGEFIKFILSKEGQEVVIKDGFYPVPSSMADASLKMVGLGKK